jgi:hypothetical protein
VLQYATDARYASASSATPEPPSDSPSELRIIVIGCIGTGRTHARAAPEGMHAVSVQLRACMYMTSAPTPPDHLDQTW